MWRKRATPGITRRCRQKRLSWSNLGAGAHHRGCNYACLPNLTASGVLDALTNMPPRSNRFSVPAQNLVYLGDFVGRELPFAGFDVVVDLFRLGNARNHTGDGGLSQQPGKGEFEYGV